MKPTTDILLDSVAPCGKRLTTFVLAYPRFIHAEFMTHRQLSRNAASSRAIPTTKLIDQALTNPAVPVEWGRNQPGMQASESLSSAEQLIAKTHWLQARDAAVAQARQLHLLGVHKQTVNRILEPFLYITVIATATEWSNFFELRLHHAAQPEFQQLARDMHNAYTTSRPVSRLHHTPLVDSVDREPLQALARELELDYTTVACRVSVGRCARVSYLTHDGKRDPRADLDLHDRLLRDRHMSPFEHVATALNTPSPSGNFVGWLQLRKTIQGECITT